jgi:dihydrofolate reductase
MSKFVASRSLQGPLDWNATLIEGDGAEGVQGLKGELDGDLFLIGCGELARNLLEQDVIDELRFWVHPGVWGDGERPFHGAAQLRLELVGSESFDSGVAVFRYEPAKRRRS